MDYSRIDYEIAGEASSSSSPAYAFVGVHAQQGKLLFRLPLGYLVPPTRHYETARDLHITFFKLFRRFRSVAQRNMERQKKDAKAHEDAGATLQDGREWIMRHDEGEVYYYRHFDAFDSLLDVFDELAILSLERRLRLTDSSPADLRHFERTDAGRVYQDDGTFFDDAAFQPVATLTVLPSDLVGLYCFLLRDLREHVWGERDPDPLQDDVRVLAEKFEYKHLWPTASCWEACEWERTRDTLRDKLELIDQVTALKDHDYHRLYDAIARYLYPPADTPHGDGILWGIDGFWPVWEWMVLTRLATEEPFKSRLCWIERGNLSPDADDALQQAGFESPLNDKEVLCKSALSWNTFLAHGRMLGHPHPDAILLPATVEQETTPESGWRWIETLTLREGLVVMTLSGMLDHLATTGTTTTRACVRTNSPPSPPCFDETQRLNPLVELTGARMPGLDRPEVFAMLHSLGEWDQGSGAFWQHAPFKSLRDVNRRHMDGLLLVDAKYKKPVDDGQAWSADHRKQAAYEDALTLSRPMTPAGYSIYICPGQAVTHTSLATLNALAEAEKARFEQEFEIQWNALADVEVRGDIFKNGGQTLQVSGQTIRVGYGGGQKLHAEAGLRRKLFPPETGVLGELAKIHLARSLIGVDHFPANNQFFLKNWPCGDLIDDLVGAG